VRELYALTEAVAKFRHYLLGHKFVVKTDQKSLRTLMEQSLQTPEQQKWLHKLLGYEFTIEYKPGKDNIPADALSRSFYVAWSQAMPTLVTLLKQAQDTDSEIQTLMKAGVNNSSYDSHYSVHQGLLLWKRRIVVPTGHEIIQTILAEFHSSVIGGHAGFSRTLARIAAQFYWKGMHHDIKLFVQQCLICQQAKMATTLPASLLQPLPIPDQIWEELAMDFITGLPVSYGFTVIYVVVDRLSKAAHFMPLKQDFTSKSVAEIFFKNVVKLHGLPKSIVSDRDKVFTSQFWKFLWQFSGTTLKMSSAYHPQSDGQSEILNKCLELYLRCFTFDAPREWSKMLAWAEYWYNTAYHTSTGMTPFRVVYGREPPKILKYVPQDNDPLSVQEQLISRDAILQKQVKLAESSTNPKEVLR